MRPLVLNIVNASHVNALKSVLLYPESKGEYYTHVCSLYNTQYHGLIILKYLYSAKLLSALYSYKHGYKDKKYKLKI